MRVSRAFLLILSILAIGQQASAKKYTIEMFIDDVSFIPGARFVLTTAYNAWSLYTEVKTLLVVNGTVVSDQLEEINEKLDILDSELKEISSDIHTLSGSVNELKSTITDKIDIDQPLQNRLYNQLDNFNENIREVNRLFDKFQEFNQTKHKFETSTYDDFVKNILDESNGQLPSALDVIHSTLTGGDQILEILTKKHLTNSLVCRDGVSPLYAISDLYKNAMKAYTKGLLMNQFAYAYKRTQENKPSGFQGESNLLIKTFYTETFEIVEKMKIIMSVASSAYWKCEVKDLHEGVTYAKLGPIFQKYFLKEQDAKDNITKCLNTCDGRKDLVIIDKCKSNFCKEQIKCSGVLVGCDKSNYQMNICLADSASNRRYHYIEGKDREDKVFEVFGKKRSCRKRIVANQKDWKLFECEYCKCTCLIDDKDVARHFSMRKVTSNVDNNKVVTGVRFAKENHIFHVQIEEGTLLKDGVIDKKSTAWKPVDKFSIRDKGVFEAVDYTTINWEKRTIHLDDLKSSGDKVLTGLRFNVVDNAVQLEIQVTPFNFKSGKLEKSKSEWISNKNNKERSEIDMSERDLPRANTYRHLDSEHNQFLKFTTSSFKDDVGQTVVPFIDLEDVTTKYRTPLSGAGLIHQANTDQSAGYLSFKLFNYNYVGHLGTE